MKRMFNKIETMLDSSWEDREKNVKIHFVITLIVAIAICFASEFLSLAVFSAGNFYAKVNNFATIFFIIYGAKFALFYIFSFVYVFFVEKRSIKTLGFVKKGMLKNYGVGLLLGTALFLATYLINIASSKRNMLYCTTKTAKPQRYIQIKSKEVHKISKTPKNSCYPSWPS